MTDELIKNIAEKLNIAVDGAASWLQMAVPQYCQMRAFSKGIGCFVLFIMFCLFAALAARSLKEYRRCKEAAKEKAWYYLENDKDNAAESLITCCFLAVFVFILFGWFLADALSWGLFPDAMVLQTLISKC